MDQTDMERALLKYGDKLPPRPWAQNGLVIRDPTGRQVLHLGGAANEHGRILEGDYLVALGNLIVEGVNRGAMVADLQSDQAACDRDWRVVGASLGVEPKREAVVQAIRRLENVKGLLDVVDLTDEQVRHVFLEIVNGRGRHGGFITAFAGAVVAADPFNLQLMRASAIQIIAKYGLTKYLTAEKI